MGEAGEDRVALARKQNDVLVFRVLDTTHTQPCVVPRAQCESFLLEASVTNVLSWQEAPVGLRPSYMVQTPSLHKEGFLQLLGPGLWRLEPRAADSGSDI